MTLTWSENVDGGQQEPESQQQSTTASPDLAAISSENEPILANFDTQNPENPITGHTDGISRSPVVPTTAAERAAPEFAQVQAAGDGAQNQPSSSPPDTIQISRRRRLAAEGDSGGGSILMSNPDTANQADQSTFYLGNAGAATIQNEELAARVDGFGYNTKEPKK